MNKIIRTLITTTFLSSCAHVRNPQISEDSKVSESTPTDNSSTIKNLDYRLDYLSYEMINVQCFNLKDLCNLQAKISCNEEFNKKEDRSLCTDKLQNTCWKKHEKCIIDNYNNWMYLKKTKKY